MAPKKRDGLWLTYIIYHFLDLHVWHCFYKGIHVLDIAVYRCIMFSMCVLTFLFPGTRDNSHPLKSTSTFAHSAFEVEEYRFLFM